MDAGSVQRSVTKIYFFDDHSIPALNLPLRVVSPVFRVPDLFVSQKLVQTVQATICCSGCTFSEEDVIRNLI